MILFEIGNLSTNEILKYMIISLIIAIIILLLASLVSTLKLLLKKDSPKYKFKPAIIKEVDEYLTLFEDETDSDKFDILECAKLIELNLKNSETVCIKKDDFYENENASVSFKEMKKLKDTGKLKVISFEEEEEITSTNINNDMATKISSLVQPTIAHSVGPIEASESFKPRQIVSPIFGSGQNTKLEKIEEVEDFYTTQQLISAELSKAEELLNGLKQLQESLK